MVADEMFPDGPGPLDFVDVEDGVRGKWMHALDVGWVQSTSYRFLLTRFGMVLLVVPLASTLS